MKSVTVVITLLATICGALDQDNCSANIMRACSSYKLSGPSICNSRYGGIERIEPEVQAYINSNIIKSYEYLLMATHFNSRQMNRPGFQKLFQGLSDSSFDDSIEMIREISRRGGKANFNVIHDSPASVSRQEMDLEVDELHSLAMALDTEKKLSNAVIHVHTRALHSPSDRDPEMANYIEENVIGKHAENVRKLNGYVNNLAQLMERDDVNMAVYMFDQYLKNQ
ncbi:ferritin light chain-like isoform X1 [Calliphora vicina]|uniref:ferritin light chain-like isoform X1 n=1 Tax=Calliphora vicina TaxID=7373 RepID=UPI00325A4F22